MKIKNEFSEIVRIISKPKSLTKQLPYSMPDQIDTQNRNKGVGKREIEHRFIVL